VHPLLLFLIAAVLPAQDGAGLLAKTRDAYRRNQDREKHWN
jgi:hypothetical protein